MGYRRGWLRLYVLTPVESGGGAALLQRDEGAALVVTLGLLVDLDAGGEDPTIH